MLNQQRGRMMAVSTIYEQLHARVNEYSVGMNSTGTGKEMKILERLFTEEEAALYLHMTRSLESPATIAVRSGLDIDKTKALLEGMTDKGITFPFTVDGVRYYAAAPFMHGFFEQQMIRKEKDPELALLMEDYITDGFRSQTITMRTVPVGINLTPRDQILSYDNVKEIILGKETIAVSPCFCRDHMLSAGKGGECHKPHDMCIAFDFYARCMVEEFKMARYISREEALQILDEAEAAGLVHQTAGNAESTEVICNCCPDCCAGLRMLKLHPAPAKAYPTNYYCEHDSALCIHCLACIERCPMGAIVDAGDHSQVQPERCIGCGLCVTACPTDAARLFIKEKVKMPPAVSTFLRSSTEIFRDLQGEIARTKE